MFISERKLSWHPWVPEKVSRAKQIYFDVLLKGNLEMAHQGYETSLHDIEGNASAIYSQITEWAGSKDVPLSSENTFIESGYKWDDVLVNNDEHKCFPLLRWVDRNLINMVFYSRKPLGDCLIHHCIHAGS